MAYLPPNPLCINCKKSHSLLCTNITPPDQKKPSISNYSTQGAYRLDNLEYNLYFPAAKYCLVHSAFKLPEDDTFYHLNNTGVSDIWGRPLAISEVAQAALSA